MTNKPATNRANLPAFRNGLQGAGSCLRRLLARLLALALLLAAADALAMQLSLAFETSGSLIAVDPQAGRLRRSDGASIPVPLKQDMSTGTSIFLYFIPAGVVSDGTSYRADLRIRFRLDDIPLSCQGTTYPASRAVYVNGATSLEAMYPQIGAYQFGLGSGDFVEFAYVPSYPVTGMGSSHYFDVLGDSFTFNCFWWTRISLTIIEPYAFDDYTPAGVDPSPVDHWMRIRQSRWPETFTDGMVLPPEIRVEGVPASGETVTLGGTNLVFSPASASTDAQGVFGFMAFVDPATFDDSPKSGGPAKAGGGTAGGNLAITHRGLTRNQPIKGFYAEVIQVEGEVNIVGGSGPPVKVGDTLLPGTTLSLSAKLGEKPAQLGLRFINGAQAQVMQDVFTNACVTDLITIGSTGFENKSVIQGKTALMSAATYLCEEMAGLPNTPEEWAKATLKFGIKLGASSLVPVPMGYEWYGFAIKYVVSNQAGKVSDQVFTAAGNYNSKSATPGAIRAKAAGGVPRLDIATYYDGSTRIAENLPGAVSLYAAGAATPFASTAEGVWQEITGTTTLARSWSETPDTIDREGPQLRMGYSYGSAYNTMTFTLRAADPSGIDTGSLAATLEGVAGSVAGAFAYQGGGVWVAEFVGGPPQAYRLHVSVADTVGNRTTMDWLGDKLHGAPTRLGAYYTGGELWAEWSPPAGLSPSDFAYYEVRVLANSFGSTQYGAWSSVGTARGLRLALPTGFLVSAPYAFEVRAVNGQGIAGAVARSANVAAVETTAALTVAKAGAGNGVVAGEGIACGADCTAFPALGASVTLGAIPLAGSTFAGWSGDCTGTGDCVVTMGAARAVTATFVTAVTPPSPRLANISTRMQVLTGNDVLIGGFIIGGSQAKRVVVRARGPSMIPLGVANALANPVLSLYSGQTVIASNDDWQDAANAGVVEATGFAPPGALESALLATLDPGPYTAIVTGAGGTTGVGIVEVFEVDRPEQPLLNISTRGQVLTGGDVMIGGFIIQGNAPQTVVVRARGPSLAPFGIANFLADPVLQLFSGQAVIATNDDWQQAANAASILSAGFAPSDARESAILVTLPPGAYTAIVSGKGGATGVGIIEVFAQ